MAGPRAGKSSRAIGPSDGGSSGKQSLSEAQDSELYSNGGDMSGYNLSIAAADGDDDMEDVGLNGRSLVGQYTATSDMLNEFAHGDTAEGERARAGSGGHLPAPRTRVVRRCANQELIWWGGVRGPVRRGV